MRGHGKDGVMNLLVLSPAPHTNCEVTRVMKGHGISYTQSVKQHFNGVTNYVEICRLQILHLPLPFAHLIWFCVLCRVSSPRWGVGWLDLPLFARSWDRRGGGGKKALWLALPGLVTRQDGEGGGGDGVVAIASQEFSSFCIYPC